jgi:hypothetical protein
LAFLLAPSFHIISTPAAMMTKLQIIIFFI